MSTNYYLKILPTEERKENIKRAIDDNNFNEVKHLVGLTYRRFSIDNIIENPKCKAEGIVHLGKRAGGWKFLWNPNVYVIRNGHGETINGTYYWIQEPDTPYYLYPLTKEGIKAFINREDGILIDEYGDIQDKEEFFNMALEWDKDGWDDAGYEKEHPYPNNMRFRHEGELINLLEKEGYEFTSWSCSDFYSDGLRFASYTDFS